MRDDVTKEMVEAYEQVRSEGRYNMITDASSAMFEIGCTVDQYWSIIRHYREYLTKFGVERIV